jgi:hypothetical protein
MKGQSDKDRILELLLNHGEVDTYSLRINGFSGNPSQRIREIKDMGYTIETERFTRADGRRYARYKLITEKQLTLAEIL